MVNWRICLCVPLLALTAGCTSTLPMAPAHVEQSVPQETPLPPVPAWVLESVLHVGPGQEFATIQDAANAAITRAARTVEVEPGTYSECAVFPREASNIAIQGMGKVIITGPTCEDKGLFVIDGNNVTVRGITFAGATARAHNGAGIRAEGTSLTVEDSQFIGNEDGILAGRNPDSTITIRRSTFRGNGDCIAACAHGIYVNRIARLRVEDSTFVEQYAGHHIKSRALATEIVGNTVRDGDSGTASYLIDVPDGGSVLISGNHLEKGPHSSNDTTAVAIGEEVDKPMNPTPFIEIDNNEFTNDMARPTFFVRNLTATPAVLQGNKLSGKIKPLEGPGSVNGQFAEEKTDMSSRTD